MNDRQTPAESRSSGPSFDFASLPNILCALAGGGSHSFVRQFAGTPMSPRHHIAFTLSFLPLHLTATAQHECPSNRRLAMTWGIPTQLFLQIHVALSLIALVAGLVVLFGLLRGRALGGWTELFLVTIILTSVTGFPSAVRARSGAHGRDSVADPA